MERSVWNVMNKWLLAIVCLAVVTACGKKEDDPEIVPDPMDETAYYIAGTVYGYESETALSGVKVTVGDVSVITESDGSYELTVSSKQKYTITFTKDAYLDASASAEIATSADNHSTVFLSVILSEKGTPVTVGAEGALVGNKPSFENSSVGLSIPAHALPDGTEAVISVTPYAEPVAASTSVQTGTQAGFISLGNIHIESNVGTFGEPVSIVWRNAATSSLAFAQADVWSNGVNVTKAPLGWEFQGAATLIGDNYVFESKQLKTAYSLETTVTIATSSPHHEANKVNDKDEVTVDNSGNVAAIKNYVLTTKVKSGWEYTTPPAQALSAAGITGNASASMAAVMRRAIEGMEGSMAGVRTIEQTTYASISGGHIMHYKNMATYYTRTYTFNCVSEGKTKLISVILKKYAGSTVIYSNVEANMHSGGKF